MSVAKQVQASSLNVELVVGSRDKLGRSKVPLFGGSPANSDIVESSLSTDAASIVAGLLNLTPYQTELLEANALSVTANGYKKVHGLDGLIAFSATPVAAIVLHSLGFARRRDLGAIANPSFIKVLETTNGSVAVATARLEEDRASRCVYVNLSVDVNSTPM